MNGLSFALGWTLFLLLFWGIGSVTKRCLHLNPCFAPVVSLSAMGVITYLGGLLGLLRPAAWAVIALGVLCVALEFRHLKANPFTWQGPPFIEGLFLLGVLAFALILGQCNLVHYDNFTHWGLVVKEMLITHAFPTAKSGLIEFTNYPTGMASLIYLVCTVAGRGENTMIMAQALLIFSAFYALFGIIQERGRFLLTVVLGTGLSLLSIFNLTIRINNLLVDFVLPTLSLAAIALIYSHRRAPNTLLVALVPILGLLVVVKSTGILFAAIPLCYLLYTLIRYVRLDTYPALVHWADGSSVLWTLGFWAKFLGAVGLSILPLMGWNARMATVFAGLPNKFETDLSLLESGPGGKTAQEIEQICQLFFRTITDPTQRATIGILLFQILAVVACILGCIYCKRKWALPKVLLLMDLVLAGYLAGILAMYIYSMPMEEAIYLAAFDRYASSIVILFGGVLTLCLTVDIEGSFYYRLGEVDDVRSFRSIQSKLLYLRSSVGCIIAIGIILTSEFNGMIYQTHEQENALPMQIQTLVGDNWSPQVDDARYLVLANDEHEQVTSYYLHYVAKYYLRANQVDTICLFYEDNLLNLLSQYDYLVIVDSTPFTQRLMKQYFALDGKPGVYDLRPLHQDV